ncbi:MAG: 16S rRNA (uracil(1498)-N(3))-methyltransferase [Proteobacteria bacterium]|nr:16S rRNA (uracil(1498)-N(3))-methyltransferase [Pseudomonadota bacterium]MBU1714970.1 16S rRNA (uracil(1498)-N(3))-methyltransferase [Pseudomonadota bacterium]
MRSFFVNPEEIYDKIARINGPDTHHLRSVLRMQAGDRIRLFDGQGKIYTGIINKISKDQTEVNILEITESQTTHPSLHLAQAMATGKKMDLIIQKATELGITGIHPFISQHCSRHQPDPNKEKRWQRIALESCKQCVRPTPPQINETTDFNKIITNADNFNRKLIFWESEEHFLLNKIDFTNINNHQSFSVLFIIGPEGGFSEQEIKLAIDHGFQTVSLGNLTLRTETAAIAAAAILQYLLGNLQRES